MLEKYKPLNQYGRHLLHRAQHFMNKPSENVSLMRAQHISTSTDFSSDSAVSNLATRFIDVPVADYIGAETLAVANYKNHPMIKENSFLQKTAESIFNGDSFYGKLDRIGLVSYNAGGRLTYDFVLETADTIEEKVKRTRAELASYEEHRPVWVPQSAQSSSLGAGTR